MLSVGGSEVMKSFILQKEVTFTSLYQENRTGKI